MGTYEFKKFKKGSKAFTLFAQKEGENYVGPRVEHNTVSNATSIGVLSPDGQLQFELELSNDAGYEYNVSSIYKGKVPDGAIAEYMDKYQVSKSKARTVLEKVTTENTWWYWQKGKWHHTEGMSGKNMYADLVDELRENAKAYYQTTINQTIGNYGGKK